MPPGDRMPPRRPEPALWMGASRRILVSTVSVALALGMGLALADPAIRADLVRPFAARGTVVLPDRQLRGWDPITVFFADTRGPADGGPEDHPDRFVTLFPAAPGAWTWVDGRTLRFTPAEAWPPLGEWAVRADGVTTRLASLSAPPRLVTPEDGATGLPPVDHLELTLPADVDPEVLRRMLTLELRPLPGLDAASATWRTGRDFTVKRLDVAPEPGGYDTGGQVFDELPSNVHYAVVLDQPIPEGTRVLVHVRLSRDDAADAFPESTVSFATAAPFTVARVGCGDTWVPVAPAGARLPADRPLACPSPGFSLDFTARPAALGPAELRNLVRVEPEVADLSASVNGTRVDLSGAFAAETAYTVTIAPALLADESGRPLQLTGPTTLPLAWRAPAAFLRWDADQALLERFGPQDVPVQARGDAQADLRIYKIDPRSAPFWRTRALEVHEDRRPPGPGEDADNPWTNPGEDQGDYARARRIPSLGSPVWSGLVPLPTGAAGRAARFGLDLSPMLDRVSGPDRPGTYLVGLRRVAGDDTRTYIRVQVTDLVLTAVEESDRVHFTVTSLQTGAPVPGATIDLEGADGTVQDDTGEDGNWATLAHVTTGADGSVDWKAPGRDPKGARRLQRIVVSAGDDVLVLDPDHPPSAYFDNHWGYSGSGWLTWAFDRLEGRQPQPETMCHVWSERPVYRPEEAVHLQGWVRQSLQGTLTPVEGPGTLLVEGPGEAKWRYPLTTDALGSFYQHFEVTDRPSGVYTVKWLKPDDTSVCSMSFRTDAYRLPTFAVELHGPPTASTDAPFPVSLTASWYAGGVVAGRPVRWRVTQFPAAWQPPARPGYVFASDARFSSAARFDAGAALERDGKTGPDGAASLPLDPTTQIDGRPRSYVVEATVTGDDAQTVTTSLRVDALPAFVLGLSSPRYLEPTKTLPIDAVAVKPDGSLTAGTKVDVHLKRREWHSVLQVSDLTSGEPRYRTDTVDVPVYDTTFTSGATPTHLTLPVDVAGVYVVELEAHDKLRRAQVVSQDLYVAGTEPQSWPRSEAGTFTLAADKDAYDPGQTASLVVQSPFSEARGTLIIEAPTGNRYSTFDVKGGAATVRVPIVAGEEPRLPVHVMLERGRRTTDAGASSTGPDLGKPATVAASTWLTVRPTDRTVAVKLTSPARALPGAEIPITVSLSSPEGKPLSGEAALWLVDRAVLALGTEQRLDPLPSFLASVTSHLLLRDTRGLALGRLPFAPNPGGDGGEDGGLLDRATVRRDVKPVPYYNPHVVIGASGTATVKVKLPDNLTVFAIRAKAVSGPQRFGAGKAEVAVRLPVVAQPVLPRFVRPGDELDLGGLARVVEGDAGAGAASIEATGLKVNGPTTQTVTLGATPAPIRFPATVLTPTLDASGHPTVTSVTVRLAVRRNADGASDAFESTLPVRDDRTPVTTRSTVDVVAGTPTDLPGLAEAARPGTTRRVYVASTDRAALGAASAVASLGAWPYGDTASAIGRARVWVALGALRKALDPAGDPVGKAALTAAVATIQAATTPSGLVAPFPGGEGRVGLTAAAFGLLTDLRADGGALVPEALYRSLQDALSRGLRSDGGPFVTGEVYVERADALAALAAARRLDEGYFAELARTATFLDADGVASVVLAGARGTPADRTAAQGLVPTLLQGLSTRLAAGREVYAGLTGLRSGRDARVLPSEAATMARIARALGAIDPTNPRRQLLQDGLLERIGPEGWGDPSANAEAVLALLDRLQAPANAPWKLQVADGGAAPTLTPTTGSLASVVTTRADKATLSLTGGGPVRVFVETRSIPAGPGSDSPATAAGFVVDRAIDHVRSGAPPQREPLAGPGQRVSVARGDVIEDRVRVTTPKDMAWVAVTVPLAAGFDALNPALATAPPEATPSGTPSVRPSWVDWRDDQVVYYFERLPAGTVELSFRARATTAGTFGQPPARAEAMYDPATHGSSPGARVVVTDAPAPR